MDWHDHEALVLVSPCAGVLHLLLNSSEEHIGVFLAGVGEAALTEYRSPQVTSVLLQEISRASPKEYARANSGAHQVGRSDVRASMCWAPWGNFLATT